MGFGANNTPIEAVVFGGIYIYSGVNEKWYKKS